MSAETRRAVRAVLAVASVFSAFLLCAQFGFLAQLRAELGRDPAALRAALAAMGLAGILGGVGAALSHRRSGDAARARAGLVAVAIAAAATTAAAGRGALIGTASGLGGALGFATVALAGGLGRLAPPGRIGRVAGWGTGLAYLVSNLPFLFVGSPLLRALFPAALCVSAALLVPPAEPRPPEPGGGAEPGLRFLGVVALFTGLVAVDSAAFAHVQETPELFAVSWGGSALELRQGAVHLLAAVLAGELLDRGRLRPLLLAAVGCFALALPALDRGGALAGAAAMLYAAGISIYSAALVAAPALGAGGVPRRARRRAAALFAVAGWVGSALGVGAADAGRSGSAAWLGLGGLGLFVLAEVAGDRRLRPALGPALLVGGAGIALGATGLAATPRGATPEARGRGVYLAEGCQHCHSQYVRPVRDDELWWGPRRPFDRSQRPPTPGTRRIGPDLSNVGLRRSPIWNRSHLIDPGRLVPGSRMPSYAHLFAPGEERGDALLAYLDSLGRRGAEERRARIAGWRPAAPPEPPSPERGARLFARHCAACHGPGGRGNGAAADAAIRRPWMDLTQRGFVRIVPARPGETTEVALARAIRFGIEPGTMAGHEWLSSQEVADLVAYVLELEGGEGAG